MPIFQGFLQKAIGDNRHQWYDYIEKQFNQTSNL